MRGLSRIRSSAFRAERQRGSDTAAVGDAAPVQQLHVGSLSGDQAGGLGH